ncbi:MAG: hypothetical protein AAGA81_20700 [Acidobacteriota bacterium]
MRRTPASNADLAHHFVVFALIFIALATAGAAGCFAGLAAMTSDRSGSGCAGIATLLITGPFTLFSVAGIWVQYRAFRYSRRQVNWLFCRRAAALACVFFPFGTVLGLWVRFLLNRPAVKASFDRPS